jgi:hypothetical protein
MQVSDSKGASLMYPKVATHTPFRDHADTQGMGAEHQDILDIATCSNSHVAGSWLGGSAADDLAYYFRPDANCTMLLSVCSDVMDVELVILTLDEVCGCLAHPVRWPVALHLMLWLHYGGDSFRWNKTRTPVHAA